MNEFPYSEDELARPLSDTELDELEAFFASEACREAGLSLSAVDGFVTALASGPERLLPAQWLPLLWGEKAPFSGPDEERKVTQRVLRHLTDIECRLQDEPDSWEPVLYQSGVPGRELLEGADWAWGYLLCVDSWREVWAPLFEDAVGESLEAMYLLGTEELEPEDKALVKTALQRHTYAKELRENALEIHRWWQPRRAPLVETVRREAAKVGRNDPCPCGSGKKYKKCCERTA